MNTFSILFLGALCALFSTSAQACPIGVSGVGDPGKSVCARVGTTTYCSTTVNSSGTWTLIGSTSGACLPTSAKMKLYQTNCPSDGPYIDRSISTQKYGGSWLDVSCTPMMDDSAGPAAS